MRSKKIVLTCMVFVIVTSTTVIMLNYSLKRYNKRADRLAVAKVMCPIVIALQKYRDSYGIVPDQEFVLKQPSHQDIWGTDFKLVNDHNIYFLISSGPDRNILTDADNIQSTLCENSK